MDSRTEAFSLLKSQLRIILDFIMYLKGILLQSLSILCI